MSRSRQHALTGIVAVSTIALALAEGGYGPGAYSVAALLAWAGVVALIAGVLAPVDVPPAALVAGTALAGVAALSLLSVAWAGDDGRAVAEAVRAAAYAGVFVLVVIASRRGEASSFLAGFGIGLAVVAAVALASRFEPSFPGGDGEIAEILPVAAGRLSHPIGYWNALGACMALGAVLLTWLGAAAETRWGRALAVGAIPLCALAIYLASSRGAVLASMVGIVVLLLAGREWRRTLGGLAIAGAGAVLLIFLASRRSELLDGVSGGAADSQGSEMLAATILVFAACTGGRWLLDGGLTPQVAAKKAIRTAGALGLAALAIAAIAGNLPSRLDEFNDPPPQEVDTEGFVSSHLTSGGGSGRYQFWSTGIDAFQEEPLAGVGAGGYEAWWNQHGSLPVSIRDAHSLFVEMLAELGILGLALVLVFLATAAVAGMRRLAPSDEAGERPPAASSAALAVLAAGTAAAAIDWLWEFPSVFVPIVAAAALLTGPATFAPADESPRSRYGWGISTLAFAWAALLVSALLGLSELKLSDSREAAGNADPSAAAQDAQDAISLQPWAAEPRLQLALIEELRGDLPAASSALDEAIERAPEDWRLQLVAVRLETKAGRVGAAEDALERARELNPRSPILSAPPGGADPAGSP